MAFYPSPVLMALVCLRGHGVAGTRGERPGEVLVAETYPECIPAECFSKLSVAVVKQIDMLDLYLIMAAVDLVIPEPSNKHNDATNSREEVRAWRGISEFEIQIFCNSFLVDF